MSSYLSLYELAVKNGFVGTQEDFVRAVLRGEHNAMIGRDKDDAHPISAITGLSEELEKIADEVAAVRLIAEGAQAAAADAQATLASAIATTDEPIRDGACYDGEAYAGETVGEVVEDGTDTGEAVDHEEGGEDT